MPALWSLPRLVVIAASSTLFASPLAVAADSLWVRLGGKTVVARVVEQTVARVAADPRVNQSFDKVNLRRLDDSIVVQICALTGGDCRYTGDDMRRAHAGLEIGEGEFNALVDALRDALNAEGVGEREKNELLRLLAPMKRDVVTR